MRHGIRRGALLALALLLTGGAPAAQGATTRFFSSFEPGDPQPTWTSAAERTHNVTDRLHRRSDEEAAWLSDPGGSQLTEVGGRTGRFADGTGTFTYRFDLPEDVTGGTVTLDIGNQFLVETSTDGETWSQALREAGDVRDLSNLAERSFQFGDTGTLWVRVGDARPENGWGGWLASVKIELSG